MGPQRYRNKASGCQKAGGCPAARFRHRARMLIHLDTDPSGPDDACALVMFLGRPDRAVCGIMWVIFDQLRRAHPDGVPGARRQLIRAGPRAQPEPGIVKRRGKLKALVAVARSILVIIWHPPVPAGTRKCCAGRSATRDAGSLGPAFSIRSVNGHI